MDIERATDDHKGAIEMMSEALIDEHNGILDSLDEVWGVGHRVVHGGEKYAESVVIDDDVVKAIDENISSLRFTIRQTLPALSKRWRCFPNGRRWQCLTPPFTRR